MNKTRKRVQGFTIVELLIVIVVIAILAAITIVAYNGIRQRANESAAQSAVSQAYRKIMAYAVENAEQYPDPLSAAGVNNTASTTYYYSVDNASAQRTFCVTAIVSSVGYYQNNTSQTTPKKGACPGHNTVVLNCPTGYIQVPGNSAFSTSDFCVMKYEAKNVGGVAASQATGLPWVSITQASAITAAQATCAGCHLITENEWMTIAANVLSVPSNWSGGAVGSGFIYSGHADNSPASALAASNDNMDGYFGTGNATGSNQRRTLILTNGEVIWDFAGNIWERTSGTLTGGQHPGVSGEVWSWKEWNVSGMQWAGLPSTSRPSAISAQAATWSSSQGIGMLLSQHGLTSFDSYLRGGYWANYNGGSGAGVLAMAIETGSRAETYIGFRVAK